MPGTTKFVSGWKTGANSAQLQVAFAWGSAPFASSCANMLDRTWYAASTSVRQVNCFRGRTHELDQWGPGTATIVLDNRTRQFDPTSTAVSNIRPGTPVKIEMVKPGASTASVLWTGFTESFELSYPGMKDSVCTVRCVDGTKYLALSQVTARTTGAGIGQMIHAVLDDVGWPSTSTDSIGWRSFGIAKSSGLTYRGFGTPALEMCRNLADSEAGFFLVDKMGRAFFRSRSYYKNVFKSTDAIFGDVTSQTTQLPYVELRLGSDDYQIWNHVQIRRVRGPVQSTWSTASYDLYGERVLRKNNLLCAAGTDAMQLARWLVARYKDPGVQVDRLTVKPRASTKLWNAVGDIGLGNLVRVIRHAPGGGSTFSQQCYVEGVAHNIRMQDDDWQVSFNMSPASLFPSSSL